jgi:hypothetical protein
VHVFFLDLGSWDQIVHIPKQPGFAVCRGR